VISSAERTGITERREPSRGCQQLPDLHQHAKLKACAPLFLQRKKDGYYIISYSFVVWCSVCWLM